MKASLPYVMNVSPLGGLHSGLSGIAGVFGLVQAFVLCRESWPAGLNAPPFGGSALAGGHAVTQ
jgi:hypothetical protein